MRFKLVDELGDVDDNVHDGMGNRNGVRKGVDDVIFEIVNDEFDLVGVGDHALNRLLGTFSFGSINGRLSLYADMILLKIKINVNYKFYG